MRRAARRPSRPADREVVSLGERMVFMQALRLALAAMIMGTAVLAPGLLRAEIGEVTFASAAYLLFSAAVEAHRRIGGRRGLRVLNWMLLVDGLFIAWVMYTTGGTQSPLRFLAYIHIIAVTLAASYRTGLKIAVWHSLLFFVVFYAQASGWMPSAESLQEGRFARASVLNVLALWLVALTTASFSTINERQLRRRRDDFSWLARLAGNLQDCRSEADIGGALISSARAAFDVKQAAVLVKKSAQLELIACDPDPALPDADLSADATILLAINEGKTLLKKRIDPHDDPGLARLMPFARNVILIPLVAENETIGVAVMEVGRGLVGVERRVVSMLEQFAAHVSLALRNAWLIEQVEMLASTDALTGLVNRRTFQEAIDHEISRARRTGDPLTLVMLDVDHFKALNDEYGHLAGDAVLKEVAAALVAESRDFDTVARYGGEEFAVVLPGCSSRESLPAAERLRKAIARIQEPTQTTASAGVATFPTHCHDVESLLRAADEALYESKRAGRDRVTRSRRRPASRSRSRPVTRIASS